MFLIPHAVYNKNRSRRKQRNIPKPYRSYRKTNPKAFIPLQEFHLLIVIVIMGSFRGGVWWVFTRRAHKPNKPKFRQKGRRKGKTNCKSRVCLILSLDASKELGFFTRGLLLLQEGGKHVSLRISSTKVKTLENRESW